MFKAINNMELIDLGLPSGTKWASCNIGANKQTEYGDYFAWVTLLQKATMLEEHVKLTTWTFIP